VNGDDDLELVRTDFPQALDRGLRRCSARRWRDEGLLVEAPLSITSVSPSLPTSGRCTGES
jgi:hypothetical protein